MQCLFFAFCLIHQSFDSHTNPNSLFLTLHYSQQYAVSFIKQQPNQNIKKIFGWIQTQKSYPMCRSSKSIIVGSDSGLLLLMFISLCTPNTVPHIMYYLLHELTHSIGFYALCNRHVSDRWCTSTSVLYAAHMLGACTCIVICCV